MIYFLFQEFDSHGTSQMDVVIAGLCNVYTHYIATYEEYQVNNYSCGLDVFNQIQIFDIWDDNSCEIMHI